jgi:hypothetical protein
MHVSSFPLLYVPTGDVPVENAKKYLHSSLFFPIPFVYLSTSLLFPVPLSFLYMKIYQVNTAQHYLYK